MTPTHVEVTACYGNRYTVRRDGIIDHEAAQAFTRGQCHALALALHRLTGWELYGLYIHDGFESGETPSHTVVRTPSGEYIDIEGNDALEGWRCHYPDAEPHAVTEAEVLEFEHLDYCAPAIDAAMPFAVTLFVKYGKDCKAQAIQRWMR